MHQIVASQSENIWLIFHIHNHKSRCCKLLKTNYWIKNSLMKTMDKFEYCDGGFTSLSETGIVISFSFFYLIIFFLSLKLSSVTWLL